MTHDLHSFWTAVWPNLAADVIWVPLVAAHHWWTRRRMDVLHATIRELRSLNPSERRKDISPTDETEVHVTTTTINWGKVFKSPQAVISLLTAAVATAGTAGIINTQLTGALQTLLVAILGVISAVGHVTASAKVAQRQAQNALRESEAE